MKGAQKEPLSDLQRLQRSRLAVTSWQNAVRLIQSGGHARAVSSYRSLIGQYPGVAQLWAELGVAAAGDLDFDTAEQALQRATELAPGNANFLVAVATEYYQIRRLDQAFACLQRAVQADPSSTQARMTLASWLERTRRFDEAWDCVEATLAQNPNNPEALCFKAHLLRGKGFDTQAEAALRELLGNNRLTAEVQANASHLLAVVLDDFGQHTEAWRLLSQSKILRRQSPQRTALEQYYDKMNQARRELLAEMTPSTLRCWREEAAASPSPRPIALVGGAPRSGTTLLEQILAVHPEIIVFDEPPAFIRQATQLFGPQCPGRKLNLESLNALSAAGRSHFIARHFKSLMREAGDKPGAKLMLEKNPSSTAWLHIWLRFFPESKIVIALRDPRDIVVSSYFFQNSAPTWGNVSFLSLERTIKFYADCMDVWLRLREMGGFDWIETRYEDVVSNLEGEGRRVTNFLGFPWQAGQAAFHEKAHSTFVHSPTYNEVIQPVHKRKVGRWENYAAELGPFQAKLQPYLQTFGYY